MNRIRMDYRISLLIVLVLCCCSAASASDLQPFRDLNEIQQMYLVGDTLYLETRYGRRELNIITEQFSLLPVKTTVADGWYREQYLPTAPATIYDKEYESLIGVSPPAWYRGSTYNCVVDTCNYLDRQFQLLSVAGEGATGEYNDVLDVARKRVYRIPYCAAGKLAVSDSALWVGYEAGLIKIDLATGARCDYFIFPKFNHISGWDDYQAKRYITTAEGILYEFQLSSGVIQQLPIPVALRDALLHISSEEQYDARNEEIFPLRFHLTNPVIKGDCLYVGVFLTDLVGRYMHNFGASAIAVYDLLRHQWSYQLIGGKFAVRRLVDRDDGIWCFGNWEESYEGATAGFAGGVACRRNNGEVQRYPALDGIPISAATFTDTELYLLPITSYYQYSDGQLLSEAEYRRVSLYSINLGSGLVSKMRELTDLDTGYNLFIPLEFSIDVRTIEEIARWRVRMRQIKVTRPAATVGR